MAVPTIKAIEGESVHRIHSGQVVLDLQSAIKELVENSMDAGATSIDVRIKDHGLESIEVVDNGSGIDEVDWPSIALKHHTSKLPSLEELAMVSTFGFRGEALSALCALCDSVVAVTSTKETAPMGAVITLGRDGRVQDSKGRIARQRGTSLTLNGLFKPLPVRRKEFERTAKREFTKALGILTAYALVPASASPSEGRSGVRLKVESIGAGRGGKRNTVLATDGRGSLRSSVSAIWGAKALEGVVDIDLELEVKVDKAMARREGIQETTSEVRVVGLVSSAAWGQGRSSADRQFMYINGRPCTLPKVTKAINEVYKSFNTNQVPLAILDFQIPKESVDINVSPDKRTIFVHSEANLIEALRTALEVFFQPTRSSYVVGGASHTVKVTQAAAPVVQSEADGEEEAGEEEEDLGIGTPPRVTRSRPLRLESKDKDVNSPPSTMPNSPSPSARPSTSRVLDIPRLAQQTLDTTVASWSPKRKQRAAVVAPIVPKAPASGRDARNNLRRSLANYASQPVRLPEEDSLEEDEEEELGEGVEPAAEDDELQPEETGSLPDGSADPEEPEDEEPRPVSPTVVDVVMEGALEVDALQVEAPSAARRPSRETRLEEDADGDKMEVQTLPEAAPQISSAMEVDVRASSPLGSPSPSLINDNDVPGSVDHSSERQGYRDEIKSSGTSGEATLRFDYKRLKRRYAARQDREAGSSTAVRNAFDIVRDGAVADAAGVGNKDAAEAEAALARSINKADFAHMEVLGQFNKGFIIARLRRGDGKDLVDDLFIVDQHASDEKFNFETLQRTTVIKAQALIKPRPMELTAADEIVAMENLDVLSANGFEVNIAEDALPGRGERISLRAMPVSKETTFDFKDLEQLLHLLSDSARPAGAMVRCTKARAMFAMRACRRSVMIGKSLSKAQMVQLLRNMGTIDQPWNCPHGRPTMRHLCSLPTSRARPGRDRIDWSKYDL